MPTYEYLCDQCGYRFEKFQMITEQPLSKCPRCKGTIHRLIGGGNGFIFKGSGFYATDYRSDSYKKAREKEVGSSDKTSANSKPKVNKD